MSSAVSERELLHNSCSIKSDSNGPIHSENHPSVLRNVAFYIIVTEFCERLAFYGFAGSLVLFFQTRLHMDNATADIQYSLWSGACYLTPLLGGYIADTRWGRYKAIIVFCTVYGIGLVLIVIGATPGATSANIVFPAIYTIALGTGGIKPNVSTLGADQFSSSPQDIKEKESFFNWFYWSINLGAGISYTFVSYICQYGIPELGGLEWSFFVGYSIPCLAMAVAIMIFLSGTKRYVLLPVQGKSVITSSLSVIYEAMWTNRSGDKVGPNNESRLDNAKLSHGGSFSDAQVESVKLVVSLLPFLAILIPFWGIYSQTNTGFQNQGCQMNLKLSDNSRIPVSALNIFNTVAIILLVPVFDSYLYPWLKSRGFSVTMLRKMGLGFAFAALAMVVAGLVEIYRRKYAPNPGDYFDDWARDNISPCHDVDDYNPYEFQQWEEGKSSSEDKPSNCEQVCDDRYVEPSTGLSYLNISCVYCDNIPQMSDISIFWQIPQFFLIGVAEILASITSLEFFYSQAPSSMRSVSQALNLLTTALGSWLIIPLLFAVNSGGEDKAWVAEDIDNGHLEYYFFLLALLMSLCLLIFVRIASRYLYKSEEELKKYEYAEEEKLVSISQTKSENLVVELTQDSGL